jgi:hypothetical protein
MRRHIARRARHHTISMYFCGFEGNSGKFSIQFSVECRQRQLGKGRKNAITFFGSSGKLIFYLLTFRHSYTHRHAYIEEVQVFRSELSWMHKWLHKSVGKSKIQSISWKKIGKNIVFLIA